MTSAANGGYVKPYLGARLEVVVDLAAVVHPVGQRRRSRRFRSKKPWLADGEPDEPGRPPRRAGPPGRPGGRCGTVGHPVGPRRRSPSPVVSHTRASGPRAPSPARHLRCRSWRSASSVQRDPPTPARSHASSSRPGGSRTAGCCPGMCSTTSTRRASRSGGAAAVLDAPPSPRAPRARRRRAGRAIVSGGVRRLRAGRRARRWPRARTGRRARPGTAAVTDLLVEPRWGRRGHGSRLLAASVDLWREDGFEHGGGLGVTTVTTAIRGVPRQRPVGSPTARPGRWTSTTCWCRSCACTSRSPSPPPRTLAI